MKLSDLPTGPDWVVWAVAGLISVLSLILISGRGSWLIAGYNTAPREEQEKYDTGKLCRVIGFGLLPIALVISAAGLWEDVLPGWFAGAAAGAILADIAAIVVLCTTMCRKK
jgi:hypothetical protein